MSTPKLDNLLEQIGFSADEVESQIKDYKLVFDATRNEKVEWHLKLPLFVPPFYMFVKTRGFVPDQNDYWHFYVSENRERLQSFGLTHDEKLGVRARVFRTYPSMVRDLHFGLFIKNRGFFRKVFYNEILDVEYGIDLAIETDSGTKIGLNLFTRTTIAQHAREVKEFRPKKQINMPCYEIPIDFKGGKSCGDFFLYSEREIAHIVEKIRDIAIPRT